MLNTKFINLIMVLHFAIVWEIRCLELMNDLFAKRILNIFYLLNKAKKTLDIVLPETKEILSQLL